MDIPLPVPFDNHADSFELSNIIFIDADLIQFPHPFRVQVKIGRLMRGRARDDSEFNHFSKP